MPVKVVHVPVTPGWAFWVPVVVALTCLALGWGAGRIHGSFRVGKIGQPVTDGRRRALGTLAGEDFDRVRSEREKAGDPERSGGDSEPVAERARLVASCADLADRLRDRQPALYAVLARDLAAVGVTVQTADGEPFDAELHNPVGTEPAADSADDLRVAATVRVGYRDHGTVVRSPDVIVYRAAGNGHDR